MSDLILLRGNLTLGLEQGDFKHPTSVSINLCIAFKRIVLLEILSCVPVWVRHSWAVNIVRQRSGVLLNKLGLAVWLKRTACAVWSEKWEFPTRYYLSFSKNNTNNRGWHLHRQGFAVKGCLLVISLRFSPLSASGNDWNHGQRHDLSYRHVASSQFASQMSQPSVWSNKTHTTGEAETLTT